VGVFGELHEKGRKLTGVRYIWYIWYTQLLDYGSDSVVRQKLIF
jgi:hypothetical protein